MRYFDEHDRERARAGASGFLAWIRSRPLESWGFFIAGVIIARILF